MEGTSKQVQQTVDAALESRWVDLLTRIGFVSKGVVYIVIGVLAAQAALGVGGMKTDPPGALQELASYRYG